MGPLLRGRVSHLAGVDLSAGMVERARARGCYDELAVAELVAHLQQQGERRGTAAWDAGLDGLHVCTLRCMRLNARACRLLLSSPSPPAARLLPGAGTCDLLVAADVFVYIGDLHAAMAAAARVAAPGCLFGFSTELHKADESSSGDGDAAGGGPQQAAGAEAAAAGGAGFVLQATGRFKHSPPYLRETAAAAGWRVLLLREAIIRYNAGQPIWGNLCVLQLAAA